MENSVQLESKSDIRPLQDDEVDAVSGGFGALFLAGFVAGVIACNVANDRPWYEF